MKKTIVIIPGLGGLSLDSKPIISYLNKNGINDCFTFKYNHKEKFGETFIGLTAKDLDKFIKNIKKKGKIYLIGVSMGGIIAAYWLEFLNGNKICKDCITLCTPFHGSYLAYSSKFKGIRELRPNNKTLKLLRKKISKSNVNYYGIWNPLDLIVMPGSSAKLNSFKKTKIIFSLFHFFTTLLRPTKEFILNTISS